MYERTKDVIYAHHGISCRKTSFPPTIAFRADRRTLKAKFFLCHHSFAASCHAVSNDFIPSVIYIKVLITIIRFLHFKYLVHFLIVFQLKKHKLHILTVYSFALPHALYWILSCFFHEESRGMFNIHQLMPADGTPSLTSIRGTAHTLMNHSACETPGWQFIAGSGFKPRLDSLEAS